MGVGGIGGAPIKLQDGGFLRDKQGEIILASLNVSELRSMASSLGGRYAGLSTDESDINYLLDQSFESGENEESLDGNTWFDSWLDLAHFLVILILPIALFCFRKGLIYVVPLAFIVPLDSQAAIWSDLWKTKDQQAQTLLEQEQYRDAADTFKRDDWSAVANYRDGDYDKTITALEGKSDATSLYNKANALAFKGELEKSIEAYEAALEQSPDHQDALHNKNIVEQLLKQQEQQQEQQEQDGEGSDEQDSEQQESGDQGEESQNQENSDSQNSEEQDSENSESSESEQQSEGSETEQEPSADEESSADKEPSASDEPSADQEPSANEKPSADQESSEDKEKETESDQKTEGENSLEQDGEETDEQTSAAQLVESDQEPLNEASEQWLRTIQDDPSGLLRRKFQYQSRERQNSNSSNDDRY